MDAFVHEYVARNIPFTVKESLAPVNRESTVLVHFLHMRGHSARAEELQLGNIQKLANGDPCRVDRRGAGALGILDSERIITGLFQGFAES